jgi:RimJ/RimL family protein N-acetyltransferase
VRTESITLAGPRIRLVPLTPDHLDALCEIGLDPRLWAFADIRVDTPDDMRDYIGAALAGQAAATALPFAIVHARTGEVIGTTRYHAMAPAHQRVEIGFTWVGAAWQRQGIGTESKYALLIHAFEVWQCQRVEFKAVGRNHPSCRSLLRLGATCEGVLRKSMMSADGGSHDVALFSIVSSEWPDVKAHLEATVGGF